MRSPAPPFLGLIACTAVAAAATPAFGPTLSEWLAERTGRSALPGRLEEISGLALDPEGELWGHDDERGVVYRIDPGSGEVTAALRLGPRPVAGDFEGLAHDGDRFHMVTSNGTLVSFRSGEGSDEVAFEMRRTAAESWCEVEGLEYDPRRGTLVMACKTPRLGEFRGHLLLLEADRPPGPSADADGPLPVRAAVVLTPDALAGAGLPRPFRASGVAYNPARDSWVVISAADELAIELARDGAVLDAVELRPRRHPQPEGVAVDASGSVLIVADEGRGGAARVTVYGGGGGR